MNYGIFPILVKKLDLFVSSPILIHIHTISFGIEISTKNGFEKQFILFDSFLAIFVGRLRIMEFFQSW
jgi:hypothetical protein